MSSAPIIIKNKLPLRRLNDEECNSLFNSITDVLNIKNPKFFYPIYNKILEDNNTSDGVVEINSGDLNNLVFDSKFKCKKIITKIIETDDPDEIFDFNENNDEDTNKTDKTDNTDTNNNSDTNEKNEKNSDLGNDFTDDIGLETVNHVENSENIEAEPNLDIDNLNENDNQSADDDIDEEELEEEDYKDKELEEAISNTYKVVAIVEKSNRKTGEVIVKEEKIHVKKSPLLEPLKLMEKHYVLPSKMNTCTKEEVIKNTQNKLNCYNNSSYVEAFFLYLGNKLVESGKCPTFPHYYGCVVGDDPNYHHNISSEFPYISKNKWFRDGVNSDYDLIIIDSKDDEKEFENLEDELENLELYADNDDDDDDEDNDDEDDKDSDIGEDVIDNSDDDNLEQINLDEKDEKVDNTVNNTVDTDFIIPLENENLDIDDMVENGTINETTQEGGNQDNNDNDNDVEDMDFIESLEEDDLDLNELEDDDDSMKVYFLKCKDIPVNLCFMESMDATLDDLLDDDYNMTENEWFSVLFQTTFGLAVAQKYFNFVHNDLHSSNIMFKKTNLSFLYYCINGLYYKIPTFGKITKIIDFARGTFKFGNRWIFSDQFKDDGEACGQYSYPYEGSLKNCEFKPNPSFDLVRLGPTIIHRLDNVPTVKKFIEFITLDDYGNSICYDEDTFDMYIDIARNCHNAVPLNVLSSKVFNRFRIPKNKIPAKQHIYIL